MDDADLWFHVILFSFFGVCLVIEDPHHVLYNILLNFIP